MLRLNSKTTLSVLCAFLLAGAVQAANIYGTITTPITITGTNRLTGNVTCAVTTGDPCIQFGANNTTLDLNGFVIEGDLTSLASTCPDLPALPQTAISTNFKNYAKVRGPGLITGFSGDGIDLTGSNSSVDHVAINVAGVNGIAVGTPGGASVNNKVLLNTITFSPVCAPGAGIAVQGAGKHQIQQNVITGGISPVTVAAIVISSNGNTILENNVSGNLSGIVVSVGNVSNVIQANQALGYLPFVGPNISDDNAPGSNTYRGNLCQTSSGSGAPACPALPAGLMGNPISLQNSQN